MSEPTNRSAPTGRHRRTGRGPRAGAPSATPYTIHAPAVAAFDRAEPSRPVHETVGSRGRSGQARSLRAAGAGVGVAIAGVVLGALAPTAAQAAEGPGLNPNQEERLRTAEREYRAEVNHDADLTKAERECMREASRARVRAMDTPARTAQVRPQQHDACRIEVALPGGTAAAATPDLPPTFIMPSDPRSPFKSGAQINRERALVLTEKLDDMYYENQEKMGFGDPLRDFYDLEPNVDPTNPFKPISLFG